MCFRHYIVIMGLCIFNWPTNAYDFKPTSFLIKTEADIAMEMDSDIQYFEDDEYLWDGGSKSDANIDQAEAGYESS